MKPDTYYVNKLAALVDQSLAPSDFSHADHIGVAVQALKENDFFKACSIIGDGIHALAIRGGEAEKFNVTITFLFMSTVGERWFSGSHSNIWGFIQKNPDLSDRSLISSVYDKERLAKPLARSTVLLPTPARATQ